MLGCVFMARVDADSEVTIPPLGLAQALTDLKELTEVSQGCEMNPACGREVLREVFPFGFALRNPFPQFLIGPRSNTNPLTLSPRVSRSKRDPDGPDF